MKVLEIKDKRARLINPSTNELRSMKDVTESDVLAIVQAVFEGVDIEYDDVPNAEDCPNEAERVVYTELKQQLDSLLTERAAILAEIERKFTEAEAFYSKELPDSSFADWASPQ